MPFLLRVQVPLCSRKALEEQKAPEFGKGSQNVKQRFLKPPFKAEIGTIFSGFKVWELLDEDKEMFQASLKCSSAFRLPFLESVVGLGLGLDLICVSPFQLRVFHVSVNCVKKPAGMI